MQKLKKILRLWLTKNELDGDLKFYDIEDWLIRKEEFHSTAEFVIVTEGALHFVLNYNYGTELTDEFEDLISSFGCYFELGNTWNLGIYKISDSDISTENENKSYSEKLKDVRWKTKRDYIVKKAKFRCQDCGKENVKFEVHHCYYIFGLEPWQYPYDSLRCLCEDCHKQRGEIEMVFRAELASLSWGEIKKLKGRISDFGIERE